MKLIELLLAKPVMEELAQMKMGAKSAYAIAKNLRKMEGDLAALNAGRDAIIKRLGVEVDGKYEIPEESRVEADREYNELLQGSAEIVPYTLSLDAMEGLELTPAQINAISWMISEDHE